MPIHDRLAFPSLTDDHSRALELFRDRLDARALFARHLNALQTPETLLWFHGDGGHGKSLLLRKLAQDYGHFLPDADRWPEVMQAERWQRLDAEASRQALQQLDAALAGPSAMPVAQAMLDFGGPGRLLQDLRQPVPALTELRRQLVAQHLQFPLFDYGMLLWLRHEGRLDKATLQQWFGSTGLDVLAQALETTLKEVPLISAVPKLLKLAVGTALGKQIDGDITQALSRWKLAPGEAEQLARLDPAGELPLQLPRLLARDLNAAMTSPDRPAPRLVLMFDTHEAFWGPEAQADGRAARHGRDEWLRLLLGGLDLGAGIVVVVAGRDAPRWHEAPDHSAIAARYLRTHLLGGLDSPDADDYLQGAGVDQADMRRALLEVAEVSAPAGAAVAQGAVQRQHHPFYLALAAETWLAMRQRGVRFDAAEFAGQQFDDAPDRNGKGRLLLDRFLKYADDRTEDAVQVLAAARRFDWPLYRHLADALGLATEHAGFERLTRLSFVHPVARVAAGAGAAEAAGAAPANHQPHYRVHDLARRILRARRAPRLVQADAVLQAHFSARAEAGDELASVEAIYHQSALDAPAAERAWSKAFDQAVERSRHALCQALAGLVAELAFSSGAKHADAGVRVARYWQSLSQHTLANEALFAALQSVQQAVEEPGVDLIEAHCTIGACHLHLAEGCAALSQHSQAQQGYDEAITSYRRALELAPEHASVWANLGVAQEGQASLLAALSRSEQAKQGYGNAIASYRRALDLAADSVAVWSNLGAAQSSLADLLAALSEHGEASQRYREAIASYRQALDLAPEDVTAWNNLGEAQRSRADMLVALSEHGEAQQGYDEAITSYRRALDLAPEDVRVWNNVGAAQQGQADLLKELSHHEEAQQRYGEAINSYDRALELAPGSVAGLNNRGCAQHGLADQLAALSEHAEAHQRYGEAVTSYRQALDIAPENVAALSNLGGAQSSLGDLLAALSEHGEASQRYREAIASYRQALDLAPEDVTAWNNLGEAQRSRADMLVALSEHGEAQQGYDEAITSYRRALDLAPEFVAAWSNLGGAQQRQADLLVVLSQHSEAMRAYVEAIDSFHRALELSPQHVQATFGLAWALLKFALWFAHQRQPEEAHVLHGLAADTAIQARDLAPYALDVIQAQVLIALTGTRLESVLCQVTNGQDWLAEARRHLDDWQAQAPADPRLAKLEAEWAQLGGR